MNRLQKKCLLATVGAHLLLVVILIVGPAFFYSRPKPDDPHVLTVIPATAIEAMFQSGVKNAQPPPPAPVHRETTPLPPPKPVVHTPPPSRPKPEPKPVEAKPAEKPEPRPKPTKREIKVNLHRVTRGTRDSKADERAAREANRQREQQARAFRSAVQNLKDNFTAATVVDMPGSSSVSYADYASIVKSKYDAAWTAPDSAASDEANVKVKVTIARDGTVVSAHVLDPSGDASVDDSVQRALDRVPFIAPFPSGATEKEKTFIINFNLKAKRML